MSFLRWRTKIISVLNPLTPNDPYSGRTAPLTSKRCILYIYSTNIGTEYFKHDLYSPFFSLQNAVCFIILMYLIPVVFTFYIQGVLKLNKNNSGAKRLITVWWSATPSSKRGCVVTANINRNKPHQCKGSELEDVVVRRPLSSSCSATTHTTVFLSSSYLPRTHNSRSWYTVLV